jgi:hypothetical protein
LERESTPDLVYEVLESERASEKGGTEVVWWLLLFSAAIIGL